MRPAQIAAVLRRSVSSAGSQTISAPACVAYRITALCRESETGHVERLMVQTLSNERIRVLGIEREETFESRLAGVVVRVECTASERGGLVRLVNRLRSETCVLSMRWESDPRATAL